MKFKNEIRTRMVERTHDGVTNEVPEQYKVPVPVLPRDWDVLAVRAGVTVVGVLTTVAVVWSTVSIGALLGGGIGFAAAVVFDLAWIVNVLLEYLSRFDADKRAFAKKLGWGLLAATMGAILWHGLLLGNVALGVVGAGVSLFAKVLWMGIMKFINRDLSEADRHWVAAEVSKANAKLAVASARRAVARMENSAAAELLAAERDRTMIQRAVAANRAELGEPVAAELPVIAHTTIPAPIEAAEVPAIEPTRSTETLTAAVDRMRLAQLAAADGYGDTWHRASREADEALEVALADGWSIKDVMGAERPATMAGRERELELKKAAATTPDASGLPFNVRPDASGRPERIESAQVNGSDEGESVRPDVPKRPEPQPQHTGPKERSERVPDQRPPSIRAGVRLLTGMGLDDAKQIATQLAQVLGQDVSEETVAREIRRAKNSPDAAPEAAKGSGTGFYN
ncbi:hypothetical protein ACVW0K_007156 [Streptomyces filamentosus]